MSRKVVKARKSEILVERHLVTSQFFFFVGLFFRKERDFGWAALGYFSICFFFFVGLFFLLQRFQFSCPSFQPLSLFSLFLLPPPPSSPYLFPFALLYASQQTPLYIHTFPSRSSSLPAFHCFLFIIIWLLPFLLPSGSTQHTWIKGRECREGGKEG